MLIMNSFLSTPITIFPDGLFIYNQYDALIGDGRAGEEAPSFEGVAHVQTHSTSDMCKALI